jgi:hypothetical protein
VLLLKRHRDRCEMLVTLNTYSRRTTYGAKEGSVARAPHQDRQVIKFKIIFRTQ